MVAYTKHDLQFILDGIQVSEAHAGATNSVVGNSWIIEDLETSRQILLDLVPNSLEPIGMRTISGELNNLVIGQEGFGATGEFPRLLDPDFRDDGATGNTETGFPLGPPGSPVITNTDYSLSETVVDSDPRIISNLIVDQSVLNPVAVFAAGADAGVDGVWGTNDDVLDDGVQLINPDGIAGTDDEFFFIPNTAPDEGLSAPFNSFFTFFGQFFDHGLDLTSKGGSGTVFIPLQPDDPLFEVGSNTNFMVLTRASVDPGLDGVLGTDDDVNPVNLTSPFVDQNQTYTSHPSHQIFVRQYSLEDRGDGPRPYATGALIEGISSGMANWGEVKLQAASALGIELTDADALNIPLFAVDQYGEFIRGANGLPQYVMSDGSLVEGNLLNPVSVAEAEVIAGVPVEARTGFSFLVDIANTANPVDSQTNMFLTRYEDGDANDGIDGGAGTYDGDLLDAHFIAGDGRANENIGLTAVHHVFHQEHNRLVEHTKEVLLSGLNNNDLGTIGDEDGAIAALDLLNGYLEVPVLTFPTTPAEIAALLWDGDRLFQAAKFGTEMQYQHLVFEEFARKVQPLVDLFASYETSIDAAIVAEFAHTVYRFGHSMLTETVDLLDTDGNFTEVGLIEAFLNPLGFNANVNVDGEVTNVDVSSMSSSETAGALIRGMTRQVGNEIDEFVTDALRNNLLGLPLDLAAINIARGRDTGIPTLNDARADFFAGTGDTKLKPYDSWVDFAQNLKHDGASIVNFIAAYGQHDLITAQDTLAGKRAAAFAITTGQDVGTSGLDGIVGNSDDIAVAITSPLDRLEFLNSTGAWASQESGLNLVDFWIGGLAEAIEPFGGMLGSTFNFVFEQQLEDLQDGDRFYYLGRTAGLNFISQLEQNSFANMIIRNTDIGDNGGDHLPGDIFSTPAFILEVDQSLQITGLENPDNPQPVLGESGVVDVTQIPPDAIFSQSFTSAMNNPVVVLMINTTNLADPVIVRLTEVTSAGFSFQLQEWVDSAPVGHGVVESVSWLAIEEGEHVLPDGTVIKAGFATAGNNTANNAAGLSAVGFDTAFDTGVSPVVLSQVINSNDPVDTVVTRQDGVSETGFSLKVQEREANDRAHIDELVGWIAIDQASGAFLDAGLTGDSVNHLPDTIAFDQTFGGIPAFIAQMQSLDGVDTSSVRGTSLTTSDAAVFVEEETSGDAEVNHTNEIVGFVALPTGQILGSSNLLNGDPTGDGASGGELNPFLDLGSNSLVIRDDLDNDGDNDLLHYTGGDHVVLGGTAENDTIIGGIGDDTIWGDGGDDDLEGGDGADIILGGEGDDVITDIGGPNNLQGQGGNDAIFAGGGESLILAGAGKDFVLQGPDFAETFGGQGDDFIHAGDESNIVFGNEGSDWLEGGGGNNLLVGDNGDPFLNSTAGGHDVFISGLGDDDYDSEGGDDIMEGADGIQRFEGLNGFDWATYKDVDQGANVDMLLRAFDETPLPPSNVSIQDRFDSVEGLSGGRGGDILRGSNQTRLEIETLNNGNNSVLTGDDRFSLIQGLREGDNGGVFDANAIFAAGVTEWGDGDIILGGAGSDLIEGRGGDDIIDGDLKLDVRLLIRDGNGTPIATAFKMQGDLFQVDSNGRPLTDINGDFIPAPLGPNNEFTNLQEAVFARAVNPGNIEILREIIDESETTDFDTAQFSDVRANYTIETVNGNPNGAIGDGDGDGYISVSHNVADVDGVDLIRNIERLQFDDQAINLAAGNEFATGNAVIVDNNTLLPVVNPAIGQELRVTPGTIADADGLSNPMFTYIWQVEEEPGSGVFVDLIVLNTAGDDGPLEGEVISVPVDALGAALRVKASFLDDDGVIETVFSAPTNAVADVSVAMATNGDDVIIGTILGDTIDGLQGNDEIQGLAGNDTLIGNLGDDTLLGGPDNDLLVGGPGNNILDGGTGFDQAEFNGNIGDGTNGDFIFGFTPEGGLEVVSTAPLGEENGVSSIEQFIFNDDTLTLAQARALVETDIAFTVGDDLIVGTAGNDAGAAANRLRGGGGNDTIFGQAGNDDLRGQAGDDLLIGGLGNDIIRGNAGDDTIIWEANPVQDDGRDVVIGGGNTLIGDTFVINGNDTDEQFTVWAVADAISAGFYTIAERDAAIPGNGNPIQIVITRNGNANGDIIAELRGIEEIVINGVGGADSFNAVGNFNASSLFTDTITINGSEGDDVVDLSNIQSDHRILFRSNGGSDVILGTLRPQDVIELAPGSDRNDYDDPVYDETTGLWTLNQSGGGHSISYQGASDMPEPSFVGNGPGFEFSNEDVTELLNLVRGNPSENLDEDTAHATGIRDLEGTGNNANNPDFGSADQPFIRLTDARYGEYDASINNNAINPIFSGLEARGISNILGTQESDLAKSDAGTSIFFMAFGQYFDHGLDFLPKGGNGILEIGTGDEAGFADLTRGSVDGFDSSGVPEHLNKASPFVDQNQAYGSNELVGQFLRESVKLDPNDLSGVPGAHLFAGVPDPSNPDFNLLPSMRELIFHHWEMNTIFTDATLPGGQMTFREYFTDLPFEDPSQPGVPMIGTLVENGVINEALIPTFNGDFMGSGFILVGDANPFINLLDHYVAGDLRANENYTLTSIHTIWARNHNFHVEKLIEAGFEGSVEELFQAAKIVNEVEYQRVVFDEFADTLLGGLKGSGEHGFDEYNPDVDASISHEFAAAAYRFGHSLIGQTIEVLDENGEPKAVSLVDVFLNPTNDNEAFTTQLPPGYVPQPGYEQVGVDPVIGGIAQQQSEEVDFNLVDAIRNDLVGIRADLFAFNVSRGWDLGLGTLNQIRADLLKSDSSYVQEAVDRSGEDLTPYESWSDFQNRNGLSNAIIVQFMAAYPDLVLDSPEDIAAFQLANPNIELTGAGNNVVKGIDRVDFWVGGLAEEHINGGVVGTTFWVVLHEQLDRLQEGDSFYYLDRAEEFDFYDIVEDQGFASIIERNTGVEGLPDDIFLVDNPASDDDDTSTNDDATDTGDTTDTDDNGDTSVPDSDDGEIAGATSTVALTLIGTELSDTLVGQAGADVLVGLAGADTLIAGEGNDTVSGGEGNDQVIGNGGDDLLLGNEGSDLIIGGEGNDRIFGGSDDDHIIGEGGNDIVDAGQGNDMVDTGAGNDTVLASLNDGNDVYNAGIGLEDVLDFSAITSDVTIDLGMGQFGSATSEQTGTDTISGFENVVAGSGEDTIIANNSQNTMAGGMGDDVFVFNTIASANGDHITDFTLGDKIDLTGIAATNNFGGNNGQFELLAEGATFSQAGQVIVRAEGENLRLEGNVDNDLDADFSILISGKSNLDQSDFS